MRARAVRMVLEHQGPYETQSEAVAAVAAKIGCIPETLKVWVRQAERDSGARDGATSAERDKIKELEHEVRQLRQANEILRKASAYFAHPFAVLMQTAVRQRDGTRPRVQALMGFIRCPAAHVYMRERGRSPRGPWGQCDLQGAADCPIHWPVSLCAPIRAKLRHASSGMRFCGPKSDASGMTTGRFSVSAKPGGGCAVRVRLRRAAPWHA
jgi:transposase